MNLEEIRYDILEELKYREGKCAMLAENSSDVSMKYFFVGQKNAYTMMYHYILHYGEDEYENEREF